MQGRNLRELEAFKDINISVGGAACTIAEVVSDSRITCNPPTPDMGQKLNTDGNAEVMVGTLLHVTCYYYYNHIYKKSSNARYIKFYT